MSAIHDVMKDVGNELSFAMQKYPAFHSYHEGYAVILEELDELWSEIKQKHPDRGALREEAIQIAAMALRFVCDLLPEDREDITPHLSALAKGILRESIKRESQ